MPEAELVPSGPVSGPEFAASPSVAERIDFVTSFLRRRYLTILICLLLCLPIAGLYLYTTLPTYTASSTMMIETRKSSFLHDSLMGSVAPDSAWIESQIGILRSVPVASYVVKQLRLADDPQFVRADTGPFGKLLARLDWGASEPKSEAERVGDALGTVMGGLEVKRVGQSYMLRIDFNSHSPEQATKVANAMIDAYIYDQLNAKYQANRRAGDWLQERLQSLREQANAADRAVVEFKAKNNIVAAGGTLMNEKQLSEISGALAAARAHASELQMRLDRIKAVHVAYQQERPVSAADENIAEAMGNPIITGLRSRYLELVNREADWSLKYGKNHQAVVNVRNQIRDLRTSIRDEFGRIEETARSELGIAKKRQDELEKGLGSLISQSTETNQAQVTLITLQAAAQSYRKIYDSFLQQHTESVQQQSFPISDARPISPAGVTKTAPRALSIWLISGFAGVTLGVGIGAFREIRDRGFRTREQVRSALGIECLALVPSLTGRRRLLIASKRSKRFSGWQALPRPGSSRVEFATSGSVAAEPRWIGSAPKVMHIILDQPLSLYAEAIRAIKLTVDQKTGAKDAKVVGLTSSLASEGKSSIAVAMATLIARSGARVILVDGDVRNPTLSRALARDANVGLLDVITGAAPLADAIWTDAASNLAFMPTIPNASLPNATELLASESARSLFGILQIKFDYVIVDLAPLAAGMDVRATSDLVESYLLVIEWGNTKIDTVQHALRHAPGVQANLIGAVLNKVDLATMSRYDTHGVDYYYGRSRYARSIN